MTTMIMTVRAYSTRIWDSPSSGQIRLTGGEYSNIGLLEIYCNGEWGTVCDDGFFGTEARVACRQLGYNDYYDYDSASITGSSSQPIWLDDVSCSSSDYNCLTSCAQCPSSQYHNCDHFEDVNLDCSYSLTYSDVYTTTSDTCENSSVSVGVIIGAVIGAIFGLICCILVFTVPFCICCCLGVGVAASSNRSPRTTVVATPTYNQTTSAIITQEDKTTSYPTQDPPPPYTQPAPQPPAYPTPYPNYPTPGYIPDPYPPQQGYPPQPDYPPHPGYPA